MVDADLEKEDNLQRVYPGDKKKHLTGEKSCVIISQAQEEGGESMPVGRLYRSMLLDFYGELLTPRQRECYELHYNEDLSLSEIAEQCGISRQGAWDNIRRASEAMEEIEAKTGLLRRFVQTEERIRSVQTILQELEAGSGDEENRKRIHAALEEVRSLLKEEN